MEVVLGRRWECREERHHSCFERCAALIAINDRGNDVRHYKRTLSGERRPTAEADGKPMYVRMYRVLLVQGWYPELSVLRKDREEAPFQSAEVSYVRFLRDVMCLFHLDLTCVRLHLGAEERDSHLSMVAHPGALYRAVSMAMLSIFVAFVRILTSPTESDGRACRDHRTISQILHNT